MTAWRPTASRRALGVRAEIARRVRDWFIAHPALEVDTPTLSSAAPTDPHVHSLHTDVAGAGRRWLQTSPEFPMKRLLAAGYGDCWQMCKVFRDGESGRMHNPEFTLLEWYRVGNDDAELMGEVDALVRYCLDGFGALGPTSWVTHADAMRMVSPAERAALDRDDDDLVFGALVAPRLGLDGPCFVTDWPVAQAALARARPDNPGLAGRFELFIAGIELANGYHELCDPVEQRRRFTADNLARGPAEVPIDERLLAALEAGLPDCAGVALGFDRLVMLALGASTIADVLTFPVSDA